MLKEVLPSFCLKEVWFWEHREPCCDGNTGVYSCFSSNTHSILYHATVTTSFFNNWNFDVIGVSLQGFSSMQLIYLIQQHSIVYVKKIVEAISFETESFKDELNLPPGHRHLLDVLLLHRSVLKQKGPLIFEPNQ